ncbi:unnamed protein product [Callosobruchus maculatus]|uniref:Transmembrane protein n=1 Tax=Callosobruchus maculatus TaxID=64391 RepID=A0A653DNC5_CALMS|nr:unnamed protein product [Callosobruchus maculatus]
MQQQNNTSNNYIWNKCEKCDGTRHNDCFFQLFSIVLIVIVDLGINVIIDNFLGMIFQSLVVILY